MSRRKDKKQIIFKVNTPDKLALMQVCLPGGWQYALVTVLNLDGYLVGGMYWPNQSNKISFFDVATGIPVTVQEGDMPIKQVNDNMHDIIDALGLIAIAIHEGGKDFRILSRGLEDSYANAVREFGKRGETLWFKGTEPEAEDAFFRLYEHTKENEEIYHKIFDNVWYAKKQQDQK